MVALTTLQGNTFICELGVVLIISPDSWVAPENSSVNFTVPDDWQLGRIWARRNCDFSDPNPETQCDSGGCPGGIVCEGNFPPPRPPVTYAEFNLSSGANKDRDLYDVTYENGYNLPIVITNNKECHVAGCAVDLSTDCQCSSSKQGSEFIDTHLSLVTQVLLLLLSKAHTTTVGRMLAVSQIAH
ncbi:hypothetical protein NLI96_g11348 [Meripilus lineatus]|uniref:Thaumatin-like protein n=1 Tax=Meripilus lineatus TaxID=2056292 RepID=A0AAD5YDD3_9APHY|nr:hypothetical protein NLI96_g11348 [Physisporinus lineatus]